MPRNVKVTLKLKDTPEQAFELPERYSVRWWDLYHQVKEHPSESQWKAPTTRELIPSPDLSPVEHLLCLDRVNEVETEMIGLLSGVLEPDSPFMIDEWWEE